jgi:L-ascorbate metabolism protein UlaG (beta-lactamase superfamily)
MQGLSLLSINQKQNSMKKILLLATAAIIVLFCEQSCTKKGGTPASGGCTKVPVVSAGDDITATGQTTVTLHGTTSESAGTWSVIDGAGGQITTGASTTFTGVLKRVYTLRFSSQNACGKSSDDVTIALNPDCGSVQTVTQMAANMHWIDQSCFRIDAGPYKIYTDPYNIKTKDTADIVVITHAHTDHFSPSDLDKVVGPNTILIAPADVTYSGTVGHRITLTPGQEFEASGCVHIKAVPAYNINNAKLSYHPKSNHWVGYLITVNGITIYDAGDTERIPEMKDFTCDIALLPLGQTYTFDSVNDAAESAKDVQAKLAIPMHFGLFEGNASDAVTFKSKLDGIIPVEIKTKE